MPNVLAALTEAERVPVVEALVHFLATTGSVVTHANPSQHAVASRRSALSLRWLRRLPRSAKRTGLRSRLATSIPLGTPSRKYTLPGLTQFLQEPAGRAARRSNAAFESDAAEARDIASFLLNDLDVVSGLQYAYYEGYVGQAAKVRQAHAGRDWRRRKLRSQPRPPQATILPCGSRERSTCPGGRLSVSDRLRRRLAAADRRQSRSSSTTAFIPSSRSGKRSR